MPTLWLIDGYNFIRGSRRFSEIETRNAEAGKTAALRWLGEFATQTGEKVRVVFDAYSGYQRDPTTSRKFSVEIWLSRGSTTADEEIAMLASELKEACVVISSDREVQDSAVRAGASILSVPEFERELGKILDGGSNDDFDAGFDAARARGKGSAFRPPREKKRAYFLLRKYQKSGQ